MDSSNPTPITPTTPTTSFVKQSPSFSYGASPPLDPTISHIISGIISDLKFLNQQQHLSDLVLEEILEKLPKLVIYTHSQTILPPRISPVPQMGSPAPSVHSEQSKVNSKPIPSEEENNSIQMSQGHSEIQYPLDQNIIDAQPPSPIRDEQEYKPEIPYKDNFFQPTAIPETSSRSSTPRHSMSRGPLPHPPNSINNTPLQHPTPPNFISKQQEAEYFRTPKIHDMLPAYSPQVVEALWDFAGADAGDLSFKKGDLIEVTEHVNDDWWRGHIKGKTVIGIFPRVYTKSISTPSERLAKNPNGHQRRTSTTSTTSISSRPFQQNTLPPSRAQQLSHVPVLLQPQQPPNRQPTSQSNFASPQPYITQSPPTSQSNYASPQPYITQAPPTSQSNYASLQSYITQAPPTSQSNYASPQPYITQAPPTSQPNSTYYPLQTQQYYNQPTHS
ncbi:9842_t:CDS:1, partial [Scutellospora calospora]